MTAEPRVERHPVRETVAPDAGTTCDVCGGPVTEVRCKIICRRCGYTRDCSDP